MSSQNPVFIPGPTNIPERLRHACNVPTIDHRSASFGAMFKPLFAGREGGAEDQGRRGHHLPRHRHRRLGGGDLQHAVARRQGPRLPPRHVLAPLDRHVQAPRPRRPAAQRPLGRRRAGRRVPGRARGRQGPRDQGRPRHPQRDRDRRPLRRRRRPPGDGRRQAPGAAPRRRRQLDRLAWTSAWTSGASTSPSPAARRASCCPTGLAIVGVSPKALAAMETAKLPRCFLDFRDMLAHQPQGRLPLHPAGQPASTASASR